MLKMLKTLNPLKRSKKLISLSLLISSFACTPALAETESLPAEQARFSIEAGVGIELIVPYFKTRVAYRLPFFDDRLDVLLDYSPHVYHPSTYYDSQVLMIGSRYYFQTQGWFQPYAVAQTGVMFHLAAPGIAGGGPIEPGIHDFMLQAGVGIDLMPMPNLGLNAQITSGLGGWLLRPELNLKVAF